MIESNTTFQDQASAIGAVGTWNGPKQWADLTADERIERLREEAQRWQNICGQLLNRLATLEGHQHSPNGEIMIQLHAANRNQMQAGTGYNYLR